MFESKRTMFDAIQAIKLSADNQVRRLSKAVDNVVPALDSSLDLSKKSTLKEVQDILQPFPGRKVDTWVMFTDEEADLWSNAIEYVNTTMRLFRISK